MNTWIPQTKGEIATLPEGISRTLEPLAKYRSDISVLGGLTVNGGRALRDSPGDHGRAGASYLTGAHPKKYVGKDIRTGVSMDQCIAQKIGSQTRFASLEFGCEECIQGGNCDSSYSCAYSPWRTESTPNPPEVRLRGSRVPVRERRGRAPSRSSRETRTIPEERFGSVLRDAERLQGQLGSTDRRKLDEYLYAVREIETRIQKTERGNAQIIPNLDKPAPSIPENDSDHTRMMFAPDDGCLSNRPNTRGHIPDGH
jgi:hypothetical protein